MPSSRGPCLLPAVTWSRRRDALRLPLGTDTLKRMADKNALVQQGTARWHNLSASTNIQ